MKNTIDETVKELRQTLLERFGEPIGDAPAVPGVPDERDECSVREDDELDEVTPPGEEKLVRALKKKKGVRNPWAIAWAQYNKKHKK